MRPLLHGTDFGDDVKQPRHLLSGVKWLFGEFHILDRKKERLLAFAHSALLKNVTCSGIGCG